MLITPLHTQTRAWLHTDSPWKDTTRKVVVGILFTSLGTKGLWV